MNDDGFPNHLFYKKEESKLLDDENEYLEELRLSG